MLTNKRTKISNPWNKRIWARPQLGKCEFCGNSMNTRYDTVCKQCDHLYLAEYSETPVHKTRGRVCRKCRGPLANGRYFDCHDCVPDHLREYEWAGFDDMDDLDTSEWTAKESE